MNKLGKVLTTIGILYASSSLVWADSVYSGRLSIDEKAVESLTEAVFGRAQNLGNTISSPTPSISSYESAARQGDSQAQAMLGGLYYLGDGVSSPNYALAKQWWEKSARHNNPIAQLGLGVLYQLGHGVRQSDKTALQWYGKACDNGHQDACDRFKDLNDNREIYVVPVHRAYRID